MSNTGSGGLKTDNLPDALKNLATSVANPILGQYQQDVGKFLPGIGSLAIQGSKILGGAHDSGFEISGPLKSIRDKATQQKILDQYNRRQLQSNQAVSGNSAGNVGGRNNRAMSGKSIGNIGGRKLFKLPSISNNILAN